MACLVLTSLIWGFAFVSQVQGMASMSPLFFNATRFTLGAISLIPLLLWKRLRRCRESGKTVGAGNREAGDDEHDMIAGSALSNPLIVGMICGVFLFAASTLQQYGIMFGRSAGRAGFITALYIVMVPLLAYLVLRRAVRMMTWMAVGRWPWPDSTCCASRTASVPRRWPTAAAVHRGPVRRSYPVDRYAGSVRRRADTVIHPIRDDRGTQLGRHADRRLHGLERGRAGVDRRAVCGNRVSRRRLHVAAVGQQWVPPTRASLIMSLESVFSVIGGALLLSETMTVRGYLAVR